MAGMTTVSTPIGTIAWYGELTSETPLSINGYPKVPLSTVAARTNGDVFDWIDDALEEHMGLTGSSLLIEPTMKRKSLFERFQRIEEKVRNVIDADYWGMPVDTPITPGMKPKKKKESRASGLVAKAGKFKELERFKQEDFAGRSVEFVGSVNVTVPTKKPKAKSKLSPTPSNIKKGKQNESDFFPQKLKTPTTAALLKQYSVATVAAYIVAMSENDPELKEWIDREFSLTKRNLNKNDIYISAISNIHLDVNAEGQEYDAVLGFPIYESLGLSGFDIAITRKITKRKGYLHRLWSPEQIETYLSSLSPEGRKTVERWAYLSTISPVNPSSFDFLESLDSISVEDERTLFISKKVNDVIKAWAESVSLEPISIAMQHAAWAVFDLEDARSPDTRKRRAIRYDDPFLTHIANEEARYASEVKAKGKALWLKNSPFFESVVRAMYANTQELLAANNITEVTLYRGMGRSHAEDKLTQSNPLSSWTISERVASGFGNYTSIGVFPASRIFSTPLSGLGCYGESEYVVVGGTDEVIERWGLSLHTSHNVGFGNAKYGKAMPLEVTPAVFCIDDDDNDADWAKMSWDLPTSPSWYIFNYGNELRSWIEKIDDLPVGRSMPQNLRDALEEHMRLTDSSSLTEPTMKRKSLFERFKKIEEKVRNVVDSEYWDAPVGTPLPLPKKPTTPTGGFGSPMSDEGRAALRGKRPRLSDEAIALRRAEIAKYDEVVGTGKRTLTDEQIYARKLMALASDWTGWDGRYRINNAVKKYLKGDEESLISHTGRVTLPKSVDKTKSRWLPSEVLEHVQSAPIKRTYRGLLLPPEIFDAIIASGTFDEPIGGSTTVESLAIDFSKGIFKRMTTPGLGAKEIDKSSWVGVVMVLDGPARSLSELPGLEDTSKYKEHLVSGRYTITKTRTTGGVKYVYATWEGGLERGTGKKSMRYEFDSDNEHDLWQYEMFTSEFDEVTGIDFKGMRYVRDAEYWGAPVGTPLPLPDRFSISRMAELSDTVPKRKTTPAKRAGKKIPDFEFYESLYKLGESQWTATDSKSGNRVVVRKNFNGWVAEFWVKDHKKPAYFVHHQFASSAFKWGIFELKLPYIQAVSNHAKREPRKQQGVGELWDGVYGIDWSETGEFLVDVNDPVARMDLAFEVADEMALSYLYVEGSQEIPVETIEVINSLLQTFNKIIPNLSNYNPVFGVDSDLAISHPHTIAYNVRVPALNADSTTYQGNIGGNNFQMGDGYIYDHSAIGLNPRYFSDDADNLNIDRVHRTSRNQYAVDHDALASAYGWEPWKATQIALLTHEIGHTLANAALGFMRSERDSNSRYKAEEMASDFKQKLTLILIEYGLFEVNEYIDRITVESTASVPSNESTLTAGPKTILRDSVQDLLSTYGSYGLHEMLAECWTEYALAEKPRPFAQAIGSLLKDKMIEFIEYDEGIGN